jgi:hypothetical protein
LIGRQASESSRHGWVGHRPELWEPWLTGRSRGVPMGPGLLRIRW